MFPESHRGLLPKYIQDREDIGMRRKPFGKPRSPVTGTGAGKFLDSDGNRVNVGNFDADGLNVNNYWDDNRNSNLGVSASRQSPLYPTEYPALRGGTFVSTFLAGFYPPA